jgi:hypothetical protein
MIVIIYISDDLKGIHYVVSLTEFQQSFVTMKRPCNNIPLIECGKCFSILRFLGQKHDCPDSDDGFFDDDEGSTLECCQECEEALIKQEQAIILLEQQQPPPPRCSYKCYK